MGGEYCEALIFASDRKELTREFRDLVERAAYDYGHAGYSGSFAEKDSVQIVGNPNGGYWNEQEAYEHCKEHNDKWGPAFAYQIAEDKYYIGGWCSS